jgi:hypothetical protein
MLDVNKSPLIGDRQKPAASVGDNDPPAIFLIGYYCQRRADAASRSKFLRDEPTQIDAGNPLLRHIDARDTLRCFLVLAPARPAGGWLKFATTLL